MHPPCFCLLFSTLDSITQAHQLKTEGFDKLAGSSLRQTLKKQFPYFYKIRNSVLNMAGINGAKFKLMPTSPEADLDAIQEAAKKIVVEFGGDNKEYEIQPVAFGLKAVIVFFFYPDDQDIETLEEKFAAIKNVASCELADQRKIC
jgi:translation elongation factor aEF-1 beta